MSREAETMSFCSRSVRLFWYWVWWQSSRRTPGYWDHASAPNNDPRLETVLSVR